MACSMLSARSPLMGCVGVGRLFWVMAQSAGKSFWCKPSNQIVMLDGLLDVIRSVAPDAVVGGSRLFWVMAHGKPFWV